MASAAGAHPGAAVRESSPNDVGGFNSKSAGNFAPLEVDAAR